MGRKLQCQHFEHLMTDLITTVAPVAESSAVPPAVFESPGAPGVTTAKQPGADGDHLAEQNGAGQEYLAGRQIAPEAAPLYTDFSRSMAEISAPAEHVGAAMDWLESLPDGNLPAQAVRHSYQVGVKLPAEDQPGLISFLNHMAEVGASQSFVDQALKFYVGLNASPASSPTDTMSDADIEAMDIADSNRARETLRAEWGPTEYAVNIAAINRLLDVMPEDRRAHLEGVDDNGKLILNNPKILRQLAQEARRQTIPSLAQAVRETKQTELAILQSWMANRRSPYWQGADAVRLQARFRDLVESNASLQPPIPSTDGIAAEIARIETMMREKPRAYFRDEVMQERYRKLIAMRDGEGT